jgi:HK97 gp10 family phage protein
VGLIEVQVEGLSDLQQALQNFPKALADKALAYALRQGANLIAAEAKRIVKPHYKSGKLYGSIAVRKRKRLPAGAALQYSVGVLGGASATYKNTKQNRRLKRVGQTFEKPNAYYWRFLEFGTQHQKAQSFLRAAFDTQGQAAIALIGSTSSRGVANAVTYAKRKGIKL